MKRYLNLGILAHVDAGKTTLTERLLHTAGVIDQIGSVAAGTTQTDSLPLEQQRGITIKSAVVSFVVDNITINLIDTPGHPDFIAEVERVQPQTRILMRALKRLRIPTLIFVNKIDRPGARPEEVFADITNKLAPASIEMGIVHDAGTKSALFSPFGSAHAPFNTLLAESLADQNDGMLAAFVENKAPSYSELRTELAHQTNRSLAHPVFFGSAILGVGVDALISGIIELLPIGEVTSEQNDGEPVSGVVLFKVERSSNGEKIAYIRMFSGSVRTRERFKIRDEQEQRITSIQVFERGSTVQRQSVSEGSIAKIWGLTAI
jgi:ribosomal protection tetracycline resistance protein